MACVYVNQCACIHSNIFGNVSELNICTSVVYVSKHVSNLRGTETRCSPHSLMPRIHHIIWNNQLTEKQNASQKTHNIQYSYDWCTRVIMAMTSLFMRLSSGRKPWSTSRFLEQANSLVDCVLTNIALESQRLRSCDTFRC